ncbi:MAG: transposase, partial [Acidobacteriaceae bacterium]|nr:transposase [Acidobacteriaceae bacterium]
VDFTLQNSPTSQKYLIETMPDGVALFGYNNDGLLDIFLVNGGRLTSPMPLPERFDRGNPRYWDRLYRQNKGGSYPGMVKQLEKDLPELLNFFSFPRHLWRKLRTTNVIERLFVEVRRRTRPMVYFVNVASVDRILCSIFHRFNLEWRNRALKVFTQAA